MTQTAHPQTRPHFIPWFCSTFGSDLVVVFTEGGIGIFPCENSIPVFDLLFLESELTPANSGRLFLGLSSGAGAQFMITRLDLHHSHYSLPGVATYSMGVGRGLVTWTTCGLPLSPLEDGDSPCLRWWVWLSPPSIVG